MLFLKVPKVHCSVDMAQTLPSNASPPRASYAGTALFAVLLLTCWTLSFVLQLLLALVTWFLLLCPGSRERFHYLQSLTFRFMNAMVPTLNPLWCIQLRYDDQPDSEAETHAPAGRVGKLIFVNHRSNVDPWIMTCVQLRLCTEAKYVYKSSLGKIPIGGWCTVLAGDLAAHFGRRDLITAMLDHARRLLSQGYNIIVFPEGTRSPSGMLQEFKASFFDIACELGCPAVPVCLFGTESAWPHGGFRMGCAHIRAYVGNAVPSVPGEGGGSRLSAAVAEVYGRLARQGLRDGLVPSDDPLLTGRPYSWWQRPEHLEALEDEELYALLRSGKAHERGQHLA